MGIITNLFVIGFFIIAFVIGFSTFSGAFASLIDEATGFFTDTNLKPKPEGNEIICDLRVKVFADLDQTIAFSEFFIRIDPEDSHNYTYFECFSQSELSLLALLDFDLSFDQLTQQAFLVSDLTETACISIVDSTDPTQKVTPNTQPNLCRDIFIGKQFEIVPIPNNVDAEFVIKNIPLREYNLEIVYQNREIFGDVTLSANEPFIGKICDQFNHLERGICVRN